MSWKRDRMLPYFNVAWMLMDRICDRRTGHLLDVYMKSTMTWYRTVMRCTLMARCLLQVLGSDLSPFPRFPIPTEILLPGLELSLLLFELISNPL